MIARSRAEKYNIDDAERGHQYQRTNKFNNYIPRSGENSDFFLNQKIESLKDSIFIRKYTNIKYSDNFPNQEFEIFLNDYYNNFEKENNFKDILEKKFQQYHTNIEWITGSNTKIIIDHIYTTCKIQMTAKSQLESEYSIFNPQDLSKTESSIEIFANSKAIFRNCHFSDAIRTALIIRDYSTAIFEHCTFENNKISTFIMNGSFVKFIDCKFKNDENISVFITKESECEMINCEFIDLEGKAIFLKDISKLKITNTRFINCQKGAATIAESCKLMIKGTTIEGSNNTALRAIRNSVINALDVNITNTNGNAINIEDSTGYFINCNINKTVHPTVAVLGRKSNPIFYNCNLVENMNTFGVICKNGSRPLFDHCNFFDCVTNFFSITDFSKPHVQNCNFKNIKKYFMNVLGGSNLSIYNIKIEDENINLDDKINILKSAKVEYKNLDDVMKDDKENETKDQDDDNEDIEEQHCSSWISPNYDIPEKMKEMDEPEIIKNGELKYLEHMKLNEMIKIADNNDLELMCSHCHKIMKEEDEPSIIVPCGHLICKDCKEIEKCPICDSPVKKIQKIYFEDECALCLDHKSNTISLPCGHMCMCYECAVKNHANNFNCPMCNEPLSGFKLLFDDYSKKLSHFDQQNQDVVNTNNNKNEETKNVLNHSNIEPIIKSNDDIDEPNRMIIRCTSSSSFLNDHLF